MSIGFWQIAVVVILVVLLFGRGKISSLINIVNLNKFKKRLDPRLYNGAILIGLNSSWAGSCPLAA